MYDQENPSGPGSDQPPETTANRFPPLLTVTQAYDYLITKNIPRSKKTIRKWCRLDHVEKKENTIPGGPKWLVTKSSLDAKLAEERLIDASLKHETSPNLFEPVPPQTGANQSVPVRDDELVEVLKEQLSHEREARKTAEDKNGELLTMYHEISVASTKVGIEIGKGMQEQGKARQLGPSIDPGSNPSAIGEEGSVVIKAFPQDEPAPSGDNSTSDDSIPDVE